ncbi:MAG: hypothetical protein JNL05_00230 [Flavobacteriales bacterium]|nr:hypothetical protein [Flavobacteriales bacterium]
MELRSLIIRWAPRVLAIAFTLFISLFALDAFEGQAGFREKAVALLMHLLPSFICVAAIALAWRREWLGALLFGALAVYYAVSAWGHPSWVFLIAGPMLLVAVSYTVAWVSRRSLTA